jgi:Ca2+-binding EF-hand superfamily protein
MTSVEEIRKIYDEFDQDQNGVLTIDEAELAYKALGPNARNINFEEHFKKLSKPDGTITFEDFKTFAK